ncbi:28S ribosomal protein S7, mitochondrial [Phasianus colchicus]|uniref:28S ribosomal protein S7, mitochondrial n=1 Tax=Phasianus colchicus TaxID=9054 RepID=UPI00129DACDD|nr:28S ribosomal protein S7, mitochondrial [Phasianus colchicus]
MMPPRPAPPAREPSARSPPGRPRSALRQEGFSAARGVAGPPPPPSCALHKMAAPTAAGLRPRLRAWLPRLVQVRWSRYNPSFLEPEVNKELYQKPFNELSEEEKEKQELKAVRPIKAAPPSISSSVFSDPMISKFTNMMMKDGNKVLARSLMAQTLENIKRKQLEKYHRAPDDEKETVECNPYVIFHQALKNCQPIIGLSNITRGGKTYQVPVPLKDNRKRFLAMKWLITECRENKHRRTLMPEKLSEELIQAFNNEGPIIKKKHVLHKMAEANRAYAHFRWW